MEKQNCIHCGKPLKKGKNHYECYDCRSIQEFARKGGNAPQHMIKRAFNKLNKVPLLWRAILFSFLLILSINCMKKLDYKEMSEKRCVVCNAPLKKNKVNKGHNKCLVCDMISKGKKVYIRNGKKLDLVSTQKKLIEHYKNCKQNTVD